MRRWMMDDSRPRESRRWPWFYTLVTLETKLPAQLVHDRHGLPKSCYPRSQRQSDGTRDHAQLSFSTDRARAGCSGADSPLCFKGHGAAHMSVRVLERDHEMDAFGGMAWGKVFGDLGDDVRSHRAVRGNGAFLHTTGRATTALWQRFCLTGAWRQVGPPTTARFTFRKQRCMKAANDGFVSDGELQLQRASSFKAHTTTVCHPRSHQQDKMHILVFPKSLLSWIFSINAISLRPSSLLKHTHNCFTLGNLPDFASIAPLCLQAFPLRAKIILRHA